MSMIEVPHPLQIIPFFFPLKIHTASLSGPKTIKNKSLKKKKGMAIG